MICGGRRGRPTRAIFRSPGIPVARFGRGRARAVWLLVVIGIGGSVLWGGEPKSEARRQSEATPLYVVYAFEHPQLDPMRFELRFDDTGRGTFAFWRQQAEEPVILSLQLLADTVERVKGYLEAVRFLESAEAYQAEREMPTLGTVTLRVRRGERERSVSFTFTRHEKMRELAQLLRGIALQEYRVFLITLARQYGPLDLDKQLRGLESELKNGWLGEPEKLLPLLHDLERDDDLLLMVRHHAGKLARWIEREKRRSGGSGKE